MSFYANSLLLTHRHTLDFWTSCRLNITSTNYSDIELKTYEIWFGIQYSANVYHPQQFLLNIWCHVLISTYLEYLNILDFCPTSDVMFFGVHIVHMIFEYLVLCCVLYIFWMASRQGRLWRSGRRGRWINSHARCETWLCLPLFSYHTSFFPAACPLLFSQRQVSSQPSLAHLVFKSCWCPITCSSPTDATKPVKLPAVPSLEENAALEVVDNVIVNVNAVGNIGPWPRLDLWVYWALVSGSAGPRCGGRHEPWWPCHRHHGRHQQLAPEAAPGPPWPTRPSQPLPNPTAHSSPDPEVAYTRARAAIELHLGLALKWVGKAAAG